MTETEEQKLGVISHFAPHPITCAPKYGKSAINTYFIENMEEFTGWEGLWLFGHTHARDEWKVGDTRLITNARGYGSELEGKFDDKLIIEI